MTISSLKVTSGTWRLNETHFDTLNLLVGISGVGKTKTLRALRIVRKAGLKGAKYASGFAWDIKFALDGHFYTWSCEISQEVKDVSWMTEATEEDDQNDNSIFLKEIIEKDGIILVNRNHADGTFFFKGTALPKIKWTESAITLMAEENDLSPLEKALQSIVASDNGSDWCFEVPPSQPLQLNSMIDIQKSAYLPLLIRAKNLQDNFPDDFKIIKENFIEIFPSIEDVKIVSVQEYFPDKKNTPFDVWTLSIKEKDLAEWIPGPDLSSGMLRTLKILLEISLAPNGTLFLIDEFENSLGVNCLPQVAEAIKMRQGQIQFILTSHHPYVINNIPWTAWKLVTRQGGVVTIHNAKDIPSLQTASSLERYLLLTNAPEYQEGIA